MNIVGVRHHKNSDKIYWFSVPNDLIGQIHEGDTLVCDTSKGESTGVAVTGVLRGEKIELLLDGQGATYPLRSIVAVQKMVPIWNIVIPDGMRLSRPAKEKLIKRVMEYAQSGWFQTKFTVSKSGCLRDGYTAYLAAKMFGLNVIPVCLHTHVGEI